VFIYTLQQRIKSSKLCSSYCSELFVPQQADHQDIPYVLLLVSNLICPKSHCPPNGGSVIGCFGLTIWNSSWNISRDLSLSLFTWCFGSLLL